MFLCLISNAQTQIDGPSWGERMLVVYPEFTSDNKALLAVPENGVLKFYDNTMTSVHQMVLPSWIWGVVEVISLDGVVGFNNEGASATITQTLFNNDNGYEFFVDDAETVVDDYGNEYFVSHGMMVKKEDGSTIWSWHTSGDNHGSTMLIKWGGNYFILTSEWHEDDEGNYAYQDTWYLIDSSTQNIKQVSAPALSVRPTVAEKGQVITVVLDNGNNATEIQVVNELGQTVKRVPVLDGQNEVKIRTDDLGTGMHIIGVQDRRNIGTCKIIVK